MEKYIILALISMVFFGANAIILKKAPDIDSISLGFFSSLSASIFIFIFWLFFVPEKTITLKGAIFSSASGLAYTIAFLLFIMALKMGKASVVVTLNALSAGVAVILAVTLLAEKITLTQIFGIVLGMIAAILLAL